MKSIMGIKMFFIRRKIKKELDNETFNCNEWKNSEWAEVARDVIREKIRWARGKARSLKPWVEYLWDMYRVRDPETEPFRTMVTYSQYMNIRDEMKYYEKMAEKLEELLEECES